MKILFEEGEPTIQGTIGGDTFYVENGRAMVRQRVTAIRPNSAPTMKETNAVGSTAKAWMSELTQDQRDAWDAFAPVGIIGIDIYIWLWSIFDWIFDLDGPLDPPLGDPPFMDFDDIVFDSCVPSIVVTLALTSGVGDEEAWIAFGPPCSPGRVPTIKDVRSIVRRAAFGVPIDCTAAYVERYGSIPPEGTPFIVAARCASFSTGAFSDVISLVSLTTCGGGANLYSMEPSDQQVTIMMGFVPPFGWSMTSAFFDGTTSVSISTTLTGVTLSPNSGIMDSSTTAIAGTLTDTSDRDETRLFRCTSEQTGAFVEISVRLVVFNFVPP